MANQLIREFLLQVIMFVRRLLEKLGLQPKLEDQNDEGLDVGGQNIMGWPKLIVTLCFSSAIDIAIVSVQARSAQLPFSFHLVSLTLLFAFTSLFLSKTIGSKFRVATRVLERVSLFFVVTGFFIAISIPFPLSLKVITWVLYVVAFLVVLVCNCFYD